MALAAAASTVAPESAALGSASGQSRTRIGERILSDEEHETTRGRGRRPDCALTVAGIAVADSYTTGGFEPPPSARHGQASGRARSPGTVNGQDGWHSSRRARPPACRAATRTTSRSWTTAPMAARPRDRTGMGVRQPVPADVERAHVRRVHLPDVLAVGGQPGWRVRGRTRCSTASSSSPRRPPATSPGCTSASAPTTGPARGCPT